MKVIKNPDFLKKVDILEIKQLEVNIFYLLILQ